jgi:Leucine-rich repeat (LRR) protein
MPPNSVLDFQGLEGSIPSELGLLTNLEHLDLSDNEGITGAIPDLSRLSALTVLRLGDNVGLAPGPIPNNMLAAMTGLQVL